MQLVSGKDTILVGIELTEDVAKDHLFGAPGGEVEKLGTDSLGQVLDLLLVHRGGLVLADLPHGLHHLDEVLVRRKRHGQVRVVVGPLLHRHDTVVVSLHAIETVQEFAQNFLSCLCAIDEVLVLRHVVDCVNVFD